MELKTFPPKCGHNSRPRSFQTCRNRPAIVRIGLLYPDLVGLQVCSRTSHIFVTDAHLHKGFARHTLAYIVLDSIVLAMFSKCVAAVSRLEVFHRISLVSRDPPHRPIRILRLVDNHLLTTTHKVVATMQHLVNLKDRDVVSTASKMLFHHFQLLAHLRCHHLPLQEMPLLVLRWTNRLHPRIPEFWRCSRRKAS
jgi:hypothetical protein